MTITPTRLYGPNTLSNSAATVYTGPNNSIAYVQAASFCNTDTVAHTIKVYVVPSGGSIGAATLVIDNQSLTAGQTYKSPELAGVVLGDGDTIQALADTSGVVNVMLNGFLMGSSGN